jgi:hypothetical protein
MYLFTRKGYDSSSQAINETVSAYARRNTKGKKKDISFVFEMCKSRHGQQQQQYHAGQKTSGQDGSRIR